MSDTESFHSAHSSPRASSPSNSYLHFSPEEEADLIATSATEKAAANTLYASSEFSAAIGAYDKALSYLPAHLDYETAVLKSNIAACHLRLDEWRQAVTAADAALEGLERVVPMGKRKKGAKDGKGKSKQAEFKWKDTGEGERVRDGDGELDDDDEDGKEEEDAEQDGSGIVELEGSEEEAAHKLAALQLNDERREQVANLRAKSLLRRARANVAMGGWGSLQSALEDYKNLSQMDNLPTRDKTFVKQQLVIIPPRAKAAQEKEMSEMMGKLKELGNGFLKPFGLSTDMFNMQKDEKTGGYSMSLNGQN